jgi:hypothetical protein
VLRITLIFSLDLYAAMTILFSFAAAIVYLYFMYWLLSRARKSKRMALLKIQLVFTAALLVLIFFAAWLRSDPKAQGDATEEAAQEAEDLEALNRCPCTWDSMKLKRDDYAEKHRKAAKSLADDEFITDDDYLTSLLSDGHLVFYSPGEGVRIQRLTQSTPYLLPEAASTFEDLAERFTDRLDGTVESDARFVVSSVTRTAGQQKEIQRQYPHGATPGESTHSFGASIDILFVETAGNCFNARRALENSLNEMQKEGVLYICPESRCIHLTAR